ncbi:MAG TPA: hypothetical protein VMW49_00680 [Candidatus Dormibacteraeota bacterium]|nr:hypothetical protein [Candidatus Dormibacteraeota bacterium]
MGSGADPPATGDPGELVVAGTDRVLDLAATWLAWDGTLRLAEDGTRLFTPNKAIRRYGDHLVDHLAEIEALLSGEESEPDRWHASAVTLASDMAAFAEADLNEARERLTRLALTWQRRLRSAGAPEWDRPRAPHWTVRQLAEHAADPWYAEQVGDLTAGPGRTEAGKGPDPTDG